MALLGQKWISLLYHTHTRFNGSFKPIPQDKYPPFKKSIRASQPGLLYNEYNMYEVMDKMKLLRLKLSQNCMEVIFKIFWILK